MVMASGDGVAMTVLLHQSSASARHCRAPSKYGSKLESLTVAEVGSDGSKPQVIPNWAT